MAEGRELQLIGSMYETWKKVGSWRTERSKELNDDSISYQANPLIFKINVHPTPPDTTQSRDNEIQLEVSHILL